MTFQAPSPFAMASTTKNQASQTHRQVAQEDLLKDLECPVCYKYMVNVIEVCGNGHGICSSCRKQIHTCPQCKVSYSTQLRNRMAETIAAKLFFPCQNADVGCSERVAGSQLAEHQSFCAKRKYNCYMDNCQWTGRAHDFLDHFKVEHNANLLLGKENIITYRNFDVKNVKKMCYLISVDEHIFFYIQDVIANQIILAYNLQFIGPKENASNFTYTLELISYDGKRNTVFRDLVMDDTKAASEIFQSGGGLQLASQFVNKFVDEERKLVHRLKITAKE